MTNLQLYLSIGIPVIANFLMLTLGFTLLNSRISDLRDHMNERFTGMEALWRAELLRVESVLDARLSHLEDQWKERR